MREKNVKYVDFWLQYIHNTNFFSEDGIQINKGERAYGKLQKSLRKLLEDRKNKTDFGK